MSYRIDDRGVLRWRPWERLSWLEHGFSTRSSGDFASPARDVAETLQAPGMQAVRVRQVHSDRVVEARDALAQPREADAVVTARPGLLLTVRTADCAPLLIVDRRRRVVAAVHAGWRGAAAGVVSRAVGRLLNDYGCQAKDLGALLGPCISAAQFEVGEEVAARFSGEAVCRIDGQPRPHLDLRASLVSELAKCGVTGERVAMINLCTHQRQDLFFSHRRSAETGRMVAAVGVRSETESLLSGTNGPCGEERGGR